MTWTKHKVMLQDSTVVENSPWVFIGDFKDVSVHIEGMVGADAIELWGSNDKGFTSVVTNEDQLGATINADDLVAVDPLNVRWLRIKHTVLGTGTVTVQLHALHVD